MPARDPQVSFVVIAHNEAQTIGKTLASIADQSLEGGSEIIVVDDGSTDATPAVVRSFARDRAEVRLIRLEQNRGRGFARRTGIDAATGGYIATVDGDIVLPKGWLSACLAALEDVDAVGGTAIPDGDVAFLYTHFKLEPKLVGHRTRVTGSNAVYRRTVFELVSFDGSLREGEDVALNHTFIRAGVRTSTVPGLVVRHEESKSAGEALVWLYQSGRGASRQLRRYREVRVPDVVFGSWLASVGVAALTGRRGRRSAWALPVGFLGAAACAHVSRAFVVDRKRAPQLLGAVFMDVGLLTAYFAGRAAGLLTDSTDAPG